MKGTVTVKDKNGIMSRVSLDDPKYKSGELVGVNAGRKWIHKGNIRKNIELKEVDKYIISGWKLERI